MLNCACCEKYFPPLHPTNNRNKPMETLNWMDMILAGLAIAIFAGGLLMLISGAWSAREK
jgi:hypothetical protein